MSVRICIAHRGRRACSVIYNPIFDTYSCANISTLFLSHTSHPQACTNITGFASNYTDTCTKGGVDSAMGWAYAGVVWVYSLVCFLIQDCVKQLAYRTSSRLRVFASSRLRVFVWCDIDQTTGCDRDDGEKRWVEPQPSSPTSHVPLSRPPRTYPIRLSSLPCPPPLPPSVSPFFFQSSLTSARRARLWPRRRTCR